MPYVPKIERPELTPRFECDPCTEGELNFQLTYLLVNYIVANGLSYERIGDVEGALQNASKEFARRVTAPYEDTKIASNGDVYGPVFDANPGVFAPKEQTTLPGGSNAHASAEDQIDILDGYRDTHGPWTIGPG
jgi:hypothetical protein